MAAGCFEEEAAAGCGPPGDGETKYCNRLNNQPQSPRGKGQGGSALSVRLDADEENIESGVEIMVSFGLRNREIEDEGVRS